MPKSSKSHHASTPASRLDRQTLPVYNLVLACLTPTQRTSLIGELARDLGTMVGQSAGLPIGTNTPGITTTLPTPRKLTPAARKKMQAAAKKRWALKKQQQTSGAKPKTMSAGGSA